VNLYFINCIFVLLWAHLFFCVWRWSCDLSHESIWCFKWCWRCI